MTVFNANLAMSIKAKMSLMKGLLLIGLAVGVVITTHLFTIVKILALLFIALNLISTFYDLVYFYRIYQYPIKIDRENRVLVYYDEYKLRQVAMDIDSIVEVKPYVTASGPLILELKIKKKEKIVEDNINISAYDNNTIAEALALLKKINPDIMFLLKGEEEDLADKKLEKVPVRELPKDIKSDGFLNN